MASGLDRIAPAGFGWAVTPSDSTALVAETRSLFIGVGGDVAVAMYDPVTQRRGSVVHKNVPSGSSIAVVTDKVYSTGTTATNIVAWA